MTAYMVIAISASWADGRQRQRRWASTILASHPDLIINDELANAGKRVARRRRYRKRWLAERNSLLHDAPLVADRNWTKARKRAIQRERIRRITESRFIFDVDNPKRWPYKDEMHFDVLSK